MWFESGRARIGSQLRRHGLLVPEQERPEGHDLPDQAIAAQVPSGRCCSTPEGVTTTSMLRLDLPNSRVSGAAIRNSYAVSRNQTLAW